MRLAWPAALLAGCGVAASTATRAPACAGPVSPSRLGAIHFLSRSLGLGLTTASPRCGPMLAITRDGGQRWVTEGTPLPRPPAGGVIEQLAATSRRTVWASSGVGPLMATTTGGSNWTVQPVPEPVVALAVTRQALWALGCPHLNNVHCRPVLAHKPLPRGAWAKRTLPWRFSTPGPELATAAARALVVASGPSDGQIRFVVSTDGGQRWRSSAPRWMGGPCLGADPATAGRVDWFVICLGGAAAGSSTKALLRTTDAGRTWTVASLLTSLTAPAQPGAISRAEPNALAAGSATRLWLAGWNSMTESDDAGRTWTDVPGVNPQGAPATFDVLSPTHAWLLAPGQGLWRTTDGRDWQEL